MATGSILKWVRPSEGIRSVLTTWDRRGDPLGKIGLRFYNLINNTDSVIGNEVDFFFARRNQIVSGLSLDDMEKVRLVMEGGRGHKKDYWRDQFSGKRDDIVVAADKMRELMRHLARRMNVSELELIEDYFPHYYSQRTIREIRAKGLLPEGEPLARPTGVWIPMHKFFRSFQRRTQAEPSVISDQ